ncbi:MAG TPA: hypothetical protein VJ856_00055 [Paludibacteraceae bacterium]|nr:hypothetical protein [Paludibacteraceae bacterium]
MKNKTVIQSTLTYDLNGYKEEVIAKTKQLIQQLIFKTNIEATRDAPKFVSIGNKFEDKGLTGKVGVIGKQSVPKNQSDPANMAAYFEFGTGLSASQILAPYPQWVKDIAYEYYVSGNGTLIGKPYLFNNFLKNIETFERDLNSLLEKEFKK